MEMGRDSYRDWKRPRWTYLQGGIRRVTLDEHQDFSGPMNIFSAMRCSWTPAALSIYLGLAPVNAQSASLTLVQTILLPGVEGRIDHFAFDSAGQRLFVCALGNNSLEVIDLRKGERVHSITGLGAPQGVGYAQEANRLLVAND